MQCIRQASGGGEAPGTAALAEATPIWVVPSNTATGVFASAEPASLTEPSALAVRLAYVGGSGATRSMVNDREPDALVTFPATSIAVAKTVCVPSLGTKTEAGVVQVPLASVVMLPT